MADTEEKPTAEQLEVAARERLSTLTIEEVIRIGHEATLRGLVAKSMAGTLSHQELTVLRNMLRDNGMTMGVPPTAPEAEMERRELPSLPAPDYDS